MISHLTSPQLKSPTSSHRLRGPGEVVVEHILQTGKDRSGEKSDLGQQRDRPPPLAASATSTTSSMGPFFLLGDHEQIADRRVRACYDSQGSVTPRTVPSRNLRHLEKFTVATGSFPACGSPARTQKAVCGRSGTSTGSQLRQCTPRIGSVKKDQDSAMTELEARPWQAQEPLLLPPQPFS